jgi:hypothetical protein
MKEILDISKLESKRPLVIKCKGSPGGYPDKLYKFYTQNRSDGTVYLGVEEQIIGRDEIGPPRYPEQETFVKQFKVREIWYSRWELENAKALMRFYEAIKIFVISIEYMH